MEFIIFTGKIMVIIIILHQMITIFLAVFIQLKQMILSVSHRDLLSNQKKYNDKHYFHKPGHPPEPPERMGARRCMYRHRRAWLQLRRRRSQRCP